MKSIKQQLQYSRARSQVCDRIYLACGSRKTLDGMKLTGAVDEITHLLLNGHLIRFDSGKPNNGLFVSVIPKKL